MNEAILTALSTISFAMIAGYLGRRFNIISAASEPAILNLFIHILLPCFIFSKVVGNEKVKLPENIILAPLAGFLGMTIPMLICYFCARYLIKIKSLHDAPAQRTFSLTCALQNYGYVAIPVIIYVFSDNLLGLMLLHNLGVELAIWSAGLMMLNGKIDKEALKKVVNTPTITVILCLTINTLGFDKYVPNMVHKPIESVGLAFMPIGLILVGATIYGCFEAMEKSSDFLRKGLPIFFWGNFFRSGVIPLIIIFLASIMPYSIDLKKILVIQAAMPAAFFPIVLARHHKGHPLIAMQISLSSLVVGFLTMPWWIEFGKKFLNL